MDKETAEALLKYFLTRPDPLCPACGAARIDPKSEYGWCPRCTGRREAQLASKRKWWNNNRGANAPAKEET